MKFALRKPFSLDNFRSLQADSICSGKAFPEGFGITPTPMEQVVPTYISKAH